MKFRVLTLTAMAIIVAAIAAMNPSASTRPLTLAHRGANMEADEDTLKAYDLAADYGIDMIETDPRLTSDGRWIIMHDPTVDRTTDGTGVVEQMAFAEVRSLLTVPGGQQVPTFEEVLELAGKRGVGVYVDMKVIPPDWADFIAMLEKHGMKDKVIMGLWWKSALVDVESKWPEMKTTISWPKPVVRLKSAKKLGADYVGTLNSLASKKMIKKSHKLGLKTVTMPINSKQEIEKFLKRGLDIIQTDDPRILVDMGIIKPRVPGPQSYNMFNPADFKTRRDPALIILCLGTDR